VQITLHKECHRQGRSCHLKTSAYLQDIALGRQAARPTLWLTLSRRRSMSLALRLRTASVGSSSSRGRLLGRGLFAAPQSRVSLGNGFIETLAL